jgi:hypothetical protein
MKRKTIKALLLSMALCVVTAFSAGTALLQANAATADELNADNFKVLGASIRLKDENDTTGDGIRFAIGVEKNVYEANADIKNNVRVLIMPTQLVSGELTIDEKYQPEGSEAYAEPADEKTSGVWTLKTMNVDGEEAEYYCTFAYMWNIPDNFYNVNLTARAYYTEDNGETASVYSTEAVRSFEYVADAALDDLKAEQETGENAKYVNPVTVGDTTMYSPYSDTQRTNIAKYLTDYTVTFKDGWGNTTTETVKYGTAVAMPEETPDCKGDFLYWQQGNEKYDFDTEVTSNITISAKQSVATTGATTLVSEQTISGDFRAEFFVGKDSLNFDYNESQNEHFGVQVVFKTADESKSAQFQLLRYDNRIQFKHYNGSSGSGTTFMTLVSGSTTASPKYTMTNDYAAAIGASLVEKDGITMVVERKGSAWDMYIKVADVYYIIKENITLNNLGSDTIAKIMLQSSNADNTNNAYVKGFTVVNNPSAITKIGYKDVKDTDNKSGSVAAVAADIGTNFRVEMFIGKETLDLAYNGGTFTNQITFRTVSGNLGFQFLRYQNRMIFKEVNKKVNMELFEIISGSTTAEPKYQARSNWPLYQDIVDSIIEEKGLSVVIERKGATWYAYIKANGNYYKVCNVGGTNSFDYSATINAEMAITSVELYAAGGASTSNPAYMKNVVVTLNPTDTITTVN